jgi:hypothetical protein
MRRRGDAATRRKRESPTRPVPASPLRIFFPSQITGSSVSSTWRSISEADVTKSSSDASISFTP